MLEIADVVKVDLRGRIPGNRVRFLRKFQGEGLSVGLYVGIEKSMDVLHLMVVSQVIFGRDCFRLRFRCLK